MWVNAHFGAMVIIFWGSKPSQQLGFDRHCGNSQGVQGPVMLAVVFMWVCPYKCWYLQAPSRFIAIITRETTNDLGVHHCFTNPYAVIPFNLIRYVFPKMTLQELYWNRYICDMFLYMWVYIFIYRERDKDSEWRGERERDRKKKNECRTYTR